MGCIPPFDVFLCACALQGKKFYLHNPKPAGFNPWQRGKVPGRMQWTKETYEAKLRKHVEPQLIQQVEKEKEEKAEKQKRKKKNKGRKRREWMARKMQEFAAQRWGTASSSSQAAAKACCLNLCCYIYSFIFMCCQIYIDFTTAHLCKAPPEMHSEEESILLRGPVQGCEPYPPDELAPSAALWSVFFQIRNLFSMIVHICANSLLFKINLDSCNVWGGMPPIGRHASQLC